MTKSKLVERVAAGTQESVEDSQKAVDAVFSFIEQAFENGDIVKVRRFGSFGGGSGGNNGEVVILKRGDVSSFRPRR